MLNFRKCKCLLLRTTYRRVHRRVVEINDSTGAYLPNPAPYNKPAVFLYVPITFIITCYIGWHFGYVIYTTLSVIAPFLGSQRHSPYRTTLGRLANNLCHLIHTKNINFIRKTKNPPLANLNILQKKNHKKRKEKNV